MHAGRTVEGGLESRPVDEERRKGIGFGREGGNEDAHRQAFRRGSVFDLAE
jgi:hypothetical protein